MKEYKLVWADEFDYQGKPDPKKWNYDIGDKKWGNGETQYYTEGLNVEVKDGQMILEGRVEPYLNAPYTSCRMTTYERKHFQYGRIEVKAKIPTAKGSWPAIWMLPVDFKGKNPIPWPRCGEIDIMEHITHQMNTVHVSLHTSQFNHVQRTQRTHFEPIKGVTESFHEFAMDWAKDYIEFFIDGKLFQRWNRNDEGYDPSEIGWPFDKPYYLIINMAIGGSWGGEVDPSHYPAQFPIEYVRYYDIIEK